MPPCRHSVPSTWHFPSYPKHTFFLGLSSTCPSPLGIFLKPAGPGKWELLQRGDIPGSIRVVAEQSQQQANAEGWEITA